MIKGKYPPPVLRSKLLRRGKPLKIHRLATLKHQRKRA